MFGKKPLPVPEPEDQVRLLPVLGMRPGVYIAIAGLLVIMVILFFILLYPGITQPGSMVIFTSEPAGAALRVNDVYAGTSPCRVFVSRGQHSMEIVLPGFEPEHMECTIPGRLFASKLVPRRYALDVQLRTNDPMAALAIAAHDYAAWTFGGEPTGTWQVPVSLSEGVYRIGAAAADAHEILAAAARFAVTRAALRDLVRANVLAAGAPPSPVSLVRSVADIAVFLADNPASAAWLADTLPPDAVMVLLSSAWYQKQFAVFAGVIAEESLARQSASQLARDLPAGQIRVGGLLFTGLESGTLARGEPFPHAVPIESFMICTTEVPASAYADFLDANPRWRIEQGPALEAQGLVTNEYLADFGVGGNLAGLGIRAVSWFAAQAFCEWLSGKLPESFMDWEIRLPTESEWEYAAKSLRRQGGPLWEWCADPYAPLPFLAASPEAIAMVGSPERPVRGGSWLNAAGSIGVETRASLPPASCSAFVSFRPVIAQKAAQKTASR
ncbi:MAG: SUMF1/EgtB/PvdO family nonheme iron enzyme [Treponema sp.]|nr:SUMF1/EgtB/PvdO family nonheme iron enzyme [Treponema sp.]